MRGVDYARFALNKFGSVSITLWYNAQPLIMHTPCVRKMPITMSIHSHSSFNLLKSTYSFPGPNSSDPSPYHLWDIFLLCWALSYLCPSSHVLPFNLSYNLHLIHFLMWASDITTAAWMPEDRLYSNMSSYIMKGEQWRNDRSLHC